MVYANYCCISKGRKQPPSTYGTKETEIFPLLFDKQRQNLESKAREDLRFCL